jgi:hypothetical protein
VRSLIQYKLFAVGVAMLCVGAVVYPQLNSVATVVEIEDTEEPELKVAEATEQPAPTSASVTLSPEQFKQTLIFKPDLPFEQARAMFVSQTSAQQKGATGTKVASLPPVTVAPPLTPPAEKVRIAWTATLPERQEIARSYLAKNCKAILALESMQSAASKQETDARFMKAKSPGHIIAIIKAQLRGHPVIVGQACPTEFYNKLFASK